MSRGPGKWQRLILEALDKEGWCIVYDLLPEDSRRSERTALNRAAHLLEKRGLIDIWARIRPQAKPVEHRGGTKHPLRTVLVAVRPGFVPPRYDGHRGQWLPASIWQVLSRVRSQVGCNWIWNEYENTPWGRGEPGYLLIERDIEERRDKERREAFLAGLNVLMERLQP